MLTVPERLKLRTSNLTHMFAGTVRTWHPQIFPKRGAFKNLLGGDMHSHERLLVHSFIRSLSHSLIRSLLFFQKLSVHESGTRQKGNQLRCHCRAERFAHMTGMPEKTASTTHCCTSLSTVRILSTAWLTVLIKSFDLHRAGRHQTCLEISQSTANVQ